MGGRAAFLLREYLKSTLRSLYALVNKFQSRKENLKKPGHFIANYCNLEGVGWGGECVGQGLLTMEQNKESPRILPGFITSYITHQH